MRPRRKTVPMAFQTAYAGSNLGLSLARSPLKRHDAIQDVCRINCAKRRNRFTNFFAIPGACRTSIVTRARSNTKCRVKFPVQPKHFPVPLRGRCMPFDGRAAGVRDTSFSDRSVKRPEAAPTGSAGLPRVMSATMACVYHHGRVLRAILAPTNSAAPIINTHIPA